MLAKSWRGQFGWLVLSHRLWPPTSDDKMSRISPLSMMMDGEWTKWRPVFFLSSPTSNDEKMCPFGLQPQMMRRFLFFCIGWWELVSFLYWMMRTRLFFCIGWWELISFFVWDDENSSLFFVSDDENSSLFLYRMMRTRLFFLYWMMRTRLFFVSDDENSSLFCIGW